MAKDSWLWTSGPRFESWRGYMKLLLTSCGIKNNSLVSALQKLAGEEIKIAFIPTAANDHYSDKSWLVKDLVNCQKLGFIDIIDIAAVPRKNWLPRLKKANVLVFGGGNTAHLMDCVVSSGLEKDLPALLKKRIYVGISAGSIIAAKTLQASSEYLYGDERKKAPKGLGFVDFNIRPHFNSPDFPRVNDENIRKLAPRLKGDVYAIDDQTGILVDGKKIEVISEGEWKVYNETSS